MKQKASPIRENIFLKFIIALISIHLSLDYALGRYAMLLCLVGHNFFFNYLIALHSSMQYNLISKTTAFEFLCRNPQFY